MVDPEVMYVLTTVGGYLAGVATSWWVQNRGKVVESLQDTAGDAIDKIEETTGIDIPDYIEDAIDDAVEDVMEDVEEAVSDAVNDMGDALKDGESLSDALHDSLKDEVLALKNSIESLDDLSIADLKVALKALGLAVGGNKGALLDRLTTALEGME
jgi:gas vesicle protein